MVKGASPNLSLRHLLFPEQCNAPLPPYADAVRIEIEALILKVANDLRENDRAEAMNTATSLVLGSAVAIQSESAPDAYEAVMAVVELYEPTIAGRRDAFQTSLLDTIAPYTHRVMGSTFLASGACLSALAVFDFPAAALVAAAQSFVVFGAALMLKGWWHSRQLRRRKEQPSFSSHH